MQTDNLQTQAPISSENRNKLWKLLNADSQTGTELHTVCLLSSQGPPQGRTSLERVVFSVKDRRQDSREASLWSEAVQTTERAGPCPGRALMRPVLFQAQGVRQQGSLRSHGVFRVGPRTELSHPTFSQRERFKA